MCVYIYYTYVYLYILAYICMYISLRYFYWCVFSTGMSAYDDWWYCVNYTTVDVIDNDTIECTRELQITLSSLENDALYQFIINASGPGGEKVAPHIFVFRTKPAGKMLTCTAFILSSKCVNTCIYMYIQRTYMCNTLYMYNLDEYMTESIHVVPKTECATMYSCFRLVGHHLQGVAHSAYDTTGFYGTRLYVYLHVHVYIRTCTYMYMYTYVQSCVYSHNSTTMGA